MRTGSIQSNAFPSNEKENLASVVPNYIPEEAIKTSEEARNPLVKDSNGNEVRAKTLFRKDGDAYGADRISVEKSDVEDTKVPDENIMPG